jgi:hypothetical protein
MSLIFLRCQHLQGKNAGRQKQKYPPLVVYVLQPRMNRPHCEVYELNTCANRAYSGYATVCVFTSYSKLPTELLFGIYISNIYCTLYFVSS